MDREHRREDNKISENKLGRPKKTPLPLTSLPPYVSLQFGGVTFRHLWWSRDNTVCQMGLTGKMDAPKKIGCPDWSKLDHI